MVKQQREVPGEIIEIRSEIEQWRQERPKRSRMPERLWVAAARLAQVHGVYRISRALRVSYDSLKHQMQRLGQRPEGSPTDVGGFVEIGGMSIVRPNAQRHLEVEVSHADGTRMVIRLVECRQSDVETMIEQFWGRLG